VSFPVEVADGAVCWSAEVTAQHQRKLITLQPAGRITLQHWMQRKKHQGESWIQIWNHFLKCHAFSFSALPPRACLLTCFNPWSADETMMLFHYHNNWWHVLLFIWHGDEHKWCIVDPDFSGGIMCYSCMWITFNEYGTLECPITWAKMLLPLAIRCLLLGKLN